MTPFLIDKRRLLTLVVTFVSVVVLSLGIGYSVGYQQLVKVSQFSLVAKKLSLPTVNANNLTKDLEVVSNTNPAVTEPGANMDVDSPDVISDESVFEKKQNEIIKNSGDTEDGIERNVVVTASLSTHVIDNNYLELLEEKPELEVASSDMSDKKFINDNATIEEAEYTIQVGYFSKKRNAEKKVNELLQDLLTGYSKTSVNKNGKTLYNVRFGYFKDKKSAASALNIYKQDYSGNGYVFRIRR